MPSFVPVAGGCRNSTTQSAVMFSAGVPRVSADTLSFRAVHMPPSASAILSQSTDSAPTTSFGDGLRCVSGATRRLGVAVASGGVAEWPAPGAPSISTLGLVPAGGATRYYYVFYRDALSYCTPAAFNLTDTQRIVWSP